MGAHSLDRYGHEVVSVFSLLGSDENDLTAALAFSVSRCPVFLAELLKQLDSHPTGEARIRLETAGHDGRTDLELEFDDALIIVEAKRGWILPGELQMRRYAGRFTGAKGALLVSLSAARSDYAAVVLPSQIDGVPVRHLAWSDVRRAVTVGLKAGRAAERHWLRELQNYLRRAARVREPQDSWTFSVVVSHGRPGGGGALTFRQYVDSGFYFHPYGAGGWPRNPPNFLAFRWNGRVQRISRALSAEVLPNLQARWPDVPVNADTDRPTVVYELGPALPGTPIPNGSLYPSARVWTLLDVLLSSADLASAVASSKKLEAL